MGIGDGRETYSDSTLMKHSKKELIDIIRVLEKNCKIYINNLNNAYDMLEKITYTDIIEFEEDE